jgi:hypothetical protein
VPSARGEDYAYEVDKYWVVAETREDDTVLLATRRGKVHRVRRDDPNLRKPTLWERWLYAARFPRTADSCAWPDGPGPAEAQQYDLSQPRYPR